MFEVLNNYKHNGHFDYSPEDKLTSVCNAPTDKSGVYLIWATDDGVDKLLYIGRSGEKVGGVIVHRKSGLGGIKDRLVNGHQFGNEPRKRIWPKIMRELGITKLSISWYDTEEDDPEEVEKKLLKEVKSTFGVLPPWNKIM